MRWWWPWSRWLWWDLTVKTPLSVPPQILPLRLSNKRTFAKTLFISVINLMHETFFFWYHFVVWEVKTGWGEEKGANERAKCCCQLLVKVWIFVIDLDTSSISVGCIVLCLVVRAMLCFYVSSGCFCCWTVGRSVWLAICG